MSKPLPKKGSKSSKVSRNISRSAARNLHHATRYTIPIGGKETRRKYPPANVTMKLALNSFVTINWALTESGEDLFTELRNQRFCRWLRTRSGQMRTIIKPTYVFAREGGHVHWLVHIPDGLLEEFLRLLPRWIASLQNKGKGPRKRAENTEPVGVGVVHYEPVYNSVGVRKYLLKGIHPAEAYRFGINAEPQGEVAGRRTGVSRNLGRSARKLAGYKSLPRPPRQVRPKDWATRSKLWQFVPGWTST
jgi:hypothetical protein